MAGMHGADVEQLRALARSFDDAASRLDNDRMSVGNAIRINAWVGPVAVRFRAEWDSAHSAKLAHAASRLHTAAAGLRRNADEQERTSMSSAGPSAPGAVPVGPGLLMGIAAGIGTTVATAGESAQNWWKAISGTVSSADLVAGVTEKISETAHVLLGGRGAETWMNFDKAGSFTKFGHLLGIAGNTVTALSIGVGLVETVSAAHEGDVGGAVWSGAKTLISVASLIPPIAPFAALLGIGIGAGELLSQNPAITKFAGDVIGSAWDGATAGVSAAVNALPAIGRGVTAAVSGATAAGGRFLGGVAQAAKKLWPW